MRSPAREYKTGVIVLKQKLPFVLAFAFSFASLVYAETYEKIDANTIRVIDGDTVTVATRVEISSVIAGHELRLQAINDRRTSCIERIDSAISATTSAAKRAFLEERKSEKTEYFDELVASEELLVISCGDIISQMDSLDIACAVIPATNTTETKTAGADE